MMMDRPACSIRTDTRKRLSRGASEVQVSQSQAIEGTPVDVPVPRKVSFILVQKLTIFICHLTSFIGHFPGFVSRRFVLLRGSFAWLSNEERSTKSHEEDRPMKD